MFPDTNDKLAEEKTFPTETCVYNGIQYSVSFNEESVSFRVIITDDGKGDQFNKKITCTDLNPDESDEIHRRAHEYAKKIIDRGI